MAYYGRTQFRVAIDIGFGDIVTPRDYQIDLMRYSKGALFEEHVSLLCYPQEFIFAEKLETVVYRGGDNSRMKDFHDLYTIIHAPNLPPLHSIKSVMEIVFQRRGTPLACPIAFEDTELDALQVMWNRYHQGIRKEDRQYLPVEIRQLLNALNAWLVKVV